MATFTHNLQGSTDTEITSSDVLQFAGGSFDAKIQVGNYQDSTHVDSGGSDKSSGNSPNNCKYVDSSTVNANGSDGSVSGLADADATLDIQFDHATSVNTESAVFYAYDGSDTADAPVEVDFQCFETGDSNWTNAEGSGSALSLADQAAATTHNFYIATSLSPDTVGDKSGKYRIELTYY